jgi:hypothetical protein
MLFYYKETMVFFPNHHNFTKSPGWISLEGFDHLRFIGN